MKSLIDKLYKTNNLSKDEFIFLLDNKTPNLSEYLFEKAQVISNRIFSNKIYLRGLIEFSNNCKNDCFYCGIRRSNTLINRYRMTKEQILASCENGYELGFRTFVLQGGEDILYEYMIDIISSIKEKFGDCAVTLSIGERPYDIYKKFFNAGADRYLLRHETASCEHYSKLHPSSMSLDNRKKCLRNLKEIGFQTGTGFMVGSPYQTVYELAEDLAFIMELKPQMVGIGPFIPHKDTPFSKAASGSLELTLFLTGIIRLMLPNTLIPATTATGTLDLKGREKAILAGANVIMLNLSPSDVRKNYLLYDNKICTQEDVSETKKHLEESLSDIGYEMVVTRGDYA